MCGIVSIFSYNSEVGVDRDELRRIRDHMITRGPDGYGEWYSPDNRVGLGHRRLAIIDLSAAGAQPMQTSDGRYVIIFNGEIYNYQALRSQLETKGYHFRSTSDTEVLLHLYADKGPDMLHDLRGMFAFVIWDNRQKRLFLARDPFGIKPIYFSDNGKIFKVASQVKALLKANNIDTDVEPAGHVGFFLWGHVPEPYTLYRGIRSLPAGHYMLVDEHGQRTLRGYCSIPTILQESHKALPPLTREEMQEELRRTLLDSIRHHLIADVPVGIFLSSGLDSATLVALASEINKSRLNTVTLGFREYIDTHNDETSLATLVADRYHTIHETVWVAKEDFQHELERLLHTMDQPTIDGVNSYFVSLAAKKAGLKVALSGLGGDEMFGSYPSFGQIPRMVELFRPYKGTPLLGKAFRTISVPFLKHLTSPKYAGLLEYGGSYSGAYLLRRGMFMPWELPGLLDEETVRKGWEELKALQRLEDTASHAKTGYLKVSALEMNWYMRNQLLRDTDWASMAHSLEVRTPLIDIDLLRNIAPLLAAKSPPNKQDMASTPSYPLSVEVMKRAKSGFAVPVREWLFERVNTKERGLRGWAKWLYNHITKSPDGLMGGLPNKKRVLISTIKPGSGGVTQMTDFIVRCIRERDLEPVLAYYEPYSISPDLSVPSFMLLQRVVGSRVESAFDGCEAHALGAWLPELEFTHYLPTTHWNDLMQSCTYLISVSGNCLASLPYVNKKRPFVAWVASPWHADRKDRVKFFPWYRKLLDTTFNANIIKKTEKHILRKGTILPLSQYTRRELNSIAGCAIANVVLPMPVNTDFFSPDDKAVATGRVGFAGRFDDPRKNIELLLQAVRCCRDKGVNLTAFLIGHPGSKSLSDYISSVNLTENISIIPHLDRESLRDVLQTLDVFVIPSHQEGLCIAALEAMSSGCPVVSTKCGGPEEFVMHGKTGYLVDFQPEAMAEAICRIVTDRKLRALLSLEARSFVEGHYSIPVSREIFWKAFHKAFHS